MLYCGGVCCDWPLGIFWPLTGQNYPWTVIWGDFGEISAVDYKNKSTLMLSWASVITRFLCPCFERNSRRVFVHIQKFSELELDGLMDVTWGQRYRKERFFDSSECCNGDLLIVPSLFPHRSSCRAFHAKGYVSIISHVCDGFSALCWASDRRCLICPLFISDVLAHQRYPARDRRDDGFWKFCLFIKSSRFDVWVRSWDSGDGD